MSDKTAQGVAGMMHLVEKYASDTADFALVGSPVSSCEPIEQAITSLIAERDSLRARVAELEQNAAQILGLARSWEDQYVVEDTAFCHVDTYILSAIAASKEAP